MNDQTYIYVIGSDEVRPVKIGMSDDPVSRLKTLQTGNPFRLHIRLMVQSDRSLEGLLHRHFKDVRTQGEWFDFGDADPVKAVHRMLSTMCADTEGGPDWGWLGKPSGHSLDVDLASSLGQVLRADAVYVRQHPERRELVHEMELRLAWRFMEDRPELADILVEAIGMPWSDNHTDDPDELVWLVMHSLEVRCKVPASDFRHRTGWYAQPEGGKCRCAQPGWRH